jgi:hypothetical protein
MESIIVPLISYVSEKDIAKLKMVSKVLRLMLLKYTKVPKNVGWCFFCGKTTLWMLYESKDFCCPVCVYSYKKDIFDIGYKCHLVKRIDVKN